jgi:hypothetical protein
LNIFKKSKILLVIFFGIHGMSNEVFSSQVESSWLRKVKICIAAVLINTAMIAASPDIIHFDLDEDSQDKILKKFKKHNNDEWQQWHPSAPLILKNSYMQVFKDKKEYCFEVVGLNPVVFKKDEVELLGLDKQSNIMCLKQQKFCFKDAQSSLVNFNNEEFEALSLAKEENIVCLKEENLCFKVQGLQDKVESYGILKKLPIISCFESEEELKKNGIKLPKEIKNKNLKPFSYQQ